MSGLKVVKNDMITFKIKMRSSPAETDSLSIKAYGSSPLNVCSLFFTAPLNLSLVEVS